jgi:hypothetical protein
MKVTSVSSVTVPAVTLRIPRYVSAERPVGLARIVTFAGVPGTIVEAESEADRPDPITVADKLPATVLVKVSVCCEE